MRVSPVTGLNDVSTAVWLTTLLLTNYNYSRRGHCIEDDVYHIQTDICHYAFQMLNENKKYLVDGARTSEHCNGDQKPVKTLPHYNYLRVDGHEPYRRLTAKGEFNNFIEKPEELGEYDKVIFEIKNDNDTYSIGGGELRRWYENVYSPFIDSINKELENFVHKPMVIVSPNTILKNFSKMLKIKYTNINLIQDQMNTPNNNQNGSIDSFGIILRIANYTQGIINVRVKFKHHFGLHDSDISIYLGSNAIEAIKPIKKSPKVNRTANPNGSPRIMGRVEMRDWIQANFKQGETLVVDVIGFNSIRLNEKKEL